MKPKLDIKKDDRFGKLIVVEQTSERYQGQVLWLCRCDCGKFSKVGSSKLRDGRKKSCGCGMGYRIAEGESNFHRLIYSYKDNAKRRSIPFLLSEDEFRKITKEDCFYCGKEPSNVFGRKSSGEPVVYSGVDRVDNSKGYVSGNCVACCRKCNECKKDVTVEIAKKMLEFLYG